LSTRLPVLTNATQRLSQNCRTLLFAIGMIFVAAACVRSPSPTIKAEDVTIRADDSGMSVFYRASGPVQDCVKHASEVPTVWALVVTPRLQKSSGAGVTMWPEDSSGRSVSIHFTRDQAGRWSSEAFCAIRIPLD
jgi:hypothetical protein